MNRQKSLVAKNDGQRTESLNNFPGIYQIDKLPRIDGIDVRIWKQCRHEAFDKSRMNNRTMRSDDASQGRTMSRMTLEMTEWCKNNEQWSEHMCRYCVNV